MSAIFGIINKNEKPLEISEANKIMQTMAHRATDGSDMWHQDNVALGHCKLEVYTQQQNERLPLESGDLVITADARIDNRGILASLLLIHKQELNELSDSQLILKAYQKWGKQCLEHLEGEFAFAIWDKQNHTLFAATDHIGFRPFFYYNDNEKFIFCSEIKGVVAAKTTPNYFNEDSLIDYYFKQGIPNQTYNKEVFALCGGNALTLTPNKFEINKYWKLQAEGKYNFKKDVDWIDCTRDLLYKTIEKRINYDVPIGITLSGGLDSTSIACILSEILQKKNKALYAFSSVLTGNYNGIEKDEREYIEIVGKHCPNIIQTYVDAPNKGPFSNLEEIFEIDECLPNTFCYIDRALLEAAREKNVKVLFSGYGGDYWFSTKGKTIICDLINKGKFQTAYQLLKDFSKSDNSSVFHAIRHKYLAQTKLYNKIRPYVKSKGIDWQVQTTLKNDFIKKHSKQINISTPSNLNIRMQELINGGRMGRRLSKFQNRANHFGIDSALPLFDKNICELLSDIPVHIFIKGGIHRSLIRNAMKGIIPKEIINRNDKLPYAPGYFDRITCERPLFSHLLNSKEHNFIFDKFIDKNIILNHFDDIAPIEGFTPGNNIVAIRIAQAAAAGISLKHLEKKDYIF